MDCRRISVIVPVYKVEPYLRRCVDSILAQTFKDFELILVDDGRPDNCGAICDEYAYKDSRVHVIHQENGGLSAARNAGIDWVYANSDSEWLTFVDSDDWIHSEYLSFLYRSAISCNTLISMCSRREIKAYEDEQAEQEISCRVMSPAEAYTYGCHSIAAYAWGRLYHKSCYEDVRFPVGRVWEDVATTYKALWKTDRIAVLDNVLYYYYLNDAGISRASWSEKNFDGLLAYDEQLVFFDMPEHAEILDKVVRGYLYSVRSNFDGLKNADLPDEKKNEHLAMLCKRMRTALKKYGKKLNIGFMQNTWYYEVAYPKLTHLYWRLKAILSRKKA